MCGDDHERTVSAFLPRWNYFEYVRPSLISVKRWGKLHLRRKSVKTDGYIRYGLTVLTTTPHVDLYITSLLRMRLYLNTPKQDHAYPLSEDVRTLPSDPRPTAPATFLSEDPCENVKNASKPSSNASPQLCFNMTSDEMRAMTELVVASERIVTAKNKFISHCSLGVYREPLRGEVALFSPALNRLRHILYKRTAKLDDLVNQANISMLKAIHIFFYGLILTGSLDDNASEFIHTFVGEANPRKQRKALLKKLKTPDSTLPWLFSLYPTWKRCIIANHDGRTPQRYTPLRDDYSVN